MEYYLTTNIQYLTPTLHKLQTGSFVPLIWHKEGRGATNLPMGPGMIIFSIKGKYLLGEFKFLTCSSSSQFLSDPPPMMPTNICH